MKKIHVIVATGEWTGDLLRYRRHRLAEFLLKQQETEEVIWLCPASKNKIFPEKLQSGITQWPISDAGESKLFRFSRFISFFYKKKLDSLIAYLEEKKNEYQFILWYTYPAYAALSERLPWDNIIYDCSDLWSHPINGTPSFLASVREKLIYQSEEKIIKQAEHITCTSLFLFNKMQERISESKKEKVYTYENGVEFDSFQIQDNKEEDILPDLATGTVFGYIGGIKPKLDFDLIKKVAQQKKDWLFLFVGPDGTNGSEDFQQLLTEKNVRWTGSVPPDLVPLYMNKVDIGIMPYKASLYNKAIFPLKLFEFLAAGKPVVGVHLPSTNLYKETGVYNPLDDNDSHVFIQACEELEKQLDNKALINRRIQLAKMKDWDTIFAEMLRVALSKEVGSQVI
ncbi:teichuronic acid biosynthesis protein TuaH [Niallia sp. 03133]|uniref:teichuronic acid biosynthesis protein TuaH n=1 Tax=Niallia sp. 03133 TaxID=3458060 RepID=UPI00404475AF